MQTITDMKQKVKKADGFANGVISALTVQQVVKEQGTGTYYKFNYFPLTKGENVTFLLSYIKY